MSQVCYPQSTFDARRLSSEKAVFTNQAPDDHIVFPSDSQSKETVVEIKNAIIVELLNHYHSKEAVLKNFPDVGDYIEGSPSENFKALVDSYSTLRVELPSPELDQIQKNEAVAKMSLIDPSFSKKIAQDSFIPNFEEISKALDLRQPSEFETIKKQQQSILASIHRPIPDQWPHRLEYPPQRDALQERLADCKRRRALNFSNVRLLP